MDSEDSMFTICGPQDDLLKRVPVVTDLADLVALTQILSNPPGRREPRSRVPPRPVDPAHYRDAPTHPQAQHLSHPALPSACFSAHTPARPSAHPFAHPSAYPSSARPSAYPSSAQPSAYSSSVQTSAYQPSAYQPSAYSSSVQASAYQPSAYQPSAYQPSVYQPSAYQPSAYQPSVQPSAYQPSVRPSAYQPSVRPSAYQPSVRPSVYQPSAYQPSVQPSAYSASAQPSAYLSSAQPSAYLTSAQPSAYLSSANCSSAYPPSVERSGGYPSSAYRSDAYPSSTHHSNAYPSSAQHPSAYPSSSTIIPFDARTYHEEITSFPQYMASPTLLSKVTWQHSSNGLVVVNCQDQKPFVGIVVGTVLPYKMNCGPAGNYISGKCDSLEKAKYRLYLSCPPQSTLAADYDTALNNLETIQNMAASTRDHKNMISVDATGKLVRAVTNVFERREKPVPDSPHSTEAERDSESKLDEITEHWPIPAEHAAEFDGVKYSHRAMPLRVQQDNKDLTADQVEKALAGALIEMHFTIQHKRIENYDSFQAKIEYIKILQRRTA